MKITRLLQHVLHPFRRDTADAGHARPDRVELGVSRPPTGIYTRAVLPHEDPAAFSSAGLAAQLARLGGGCDAAQVPFRVMMELGGDVNKLARHFDGSGWSVQRPVADCSHWPNWAPGESEDRYVRLESPSLTLADGGIEKLTEVLDRARQAGAALGPTGAMRFYVPQDALSAEATSAFVTMHRSNGDMLQRLGCSGEVGRSSEHKNEYASMTADVLSSHGGLNKSQQGQWELKYFDPTFEPRALAADVGLVLGMVKAANEGRAGGSLEAWVGQGALRDRLLAQLKAAGGSIEAA